MPNIAAVLKEEIARVARKELRGETDKLKRLSAQYRADIAALKRRLGALEKTVAQLHRNAAKQGAQAASPQGGGRVRFSAKGLAAQRQRLGLSAAQMGSLVGVSAQTIYNWEAGSTRPREQQVVAIAAVRGLGKRRAQERLQQLAS